MANKRPTQASKILRHLQTYGSITPQEAMADYGIWRLGARIFELKENGYAITAERVDGRNRFGEPTHWAKYKYIGSEQEANNDTI